MNAENKKVVGKLLLHAKLADGGYMYIYGSTNYPGVNVTFIKDDRKSKERREIAYKDQIYETMEGVAAAWADDQEDPLT